MPRPARRSPEPARLIYAASEASADLAWATGFFAPDPFLFLRHRNRTTLLLSDLEIDRGRRDARADQVDAWSGVSTPLRRRLGREPKPGEVIATFLRRRRVRRVRVPGAFPAGLLRELESAGVRVEVPEGPFFPQREIKRPDEVRAIEAALRITEAGLARGMEVLRASQPGRDRRLRWAGAVLTSERLRGEIDAAVVRAGGIPANTIVAGGVQACDPHERGSGPLRAGELIILDVFPRDARSGYYGDLTRTVVRGRASDTRRALWEQVRAGQSQAIRAIRPGASGARIHQAIKDRFARAGHPTEVRDGRWVGFFHGTGHGLGLDLHEEPRFGATRLRRGQVWTVEPGLYDPAIGGVRIEDVVVVTVTGCRVLSRFPTECEL